MVGESWYWPIWMTEASNRYKKPCSTTTYIIILALADITRSLVLHPEGLGTQLQTATVSEGAGYRLAAHHCLQW